MIMTTTYFTGKVPFHDVYINAIVRDEEGNKMSKSKGNVLDPLDLIDGVDLDALVAKRTANMMDPRQAEPIAKRTRRQFPNGIPAFGADAVRFTFASLATFNRTLNFDLNRCDGYRNFCNKLWNATRFVLMNVEGKDVGLDESLPLAPTFADRWIVAKLQDAEDEIRRQLDGYRFDHAAKALYEFVWNEYCDWYVELAKVSLARGDQAQQRATRRTLVRVLEATLRLAHPFIPFITEELWQPVAPLAGKKGETVSLQPYPLADSAKRAPEAEAAVATLKALVDAARSLRAEMGLSPGQKVGALVMRGAAAATVAAGTAHGTHAASQPPADAGYLDELVPYVEALARLSSMRVVDALPASPAPVALVEPLRLMLEVEVDPVAERARLDKERARIAGEVTKARAQLANERVVARAPARVGEEMRARLAQFEATLVKLEEQFERLSA
jgi:valyl-tRNA synthetase